MGDDTCLPVPCGGAQDAELGEAAVEQYHVGEGVIAGVAGGGAGQARRHDPQVCEGASFLDGVVQADGDRGLQVGLEQSVFGADVEVVRRHDGDRQSADGVGGVRGAGHREPMLGAVAAVHSDAHHKRRASTRRSPENQGL